MGTVVRLITYANYKFLRPKRKEIFKSIPLKDLKGELFFESVKLSTSGLNNFHDTFGDEEHCLL